MASPYKKRSTYRFTPELERIIIQEAKKLGISKNAFVQMTLVKALSLSPIGNVKTE